MKNSRYRENEVFITLPENIEKVKRKRQMIQLKATRDEVIKSNINSFMAQAVKLNKTVNNNIRIPTEGSVEGNKFVWVSTIQSIPHNEEKYKQKLKMNTLIFNEERSINHDTSFQFKSLHNISTDNTFNKQSIPSLDLRHNLTIKPKIKKPSTGYCSHKPNPLQFKLNPKLKHLLLNNNQKKLKGNYTSFQPKEPSNSNNDTSENIITKSFLPIYKVIEFDTIEHKKILNHQISLITSTEEIAVGDFFSTKYRQLTKYSNLNTQSTALNNKISPNIKSKSNAYKRINTIQITKHMPIHSKIHAHVNTMHHNENIKTKQDQMLRWKRVMITAAIDFNRLHMKLPQLMSLKSSNISPYKQSNSYEMFQAVRGEEKKLFLFYIQKNRLLLLDFDHSHQTVLHWMAKRNLYDWISVSVRNGANVNAKDDTGRTALHIAVINGHFESVMILLFEMSNPFIKDNWLKKAGDYTKDYRLLFILSRVVQLYVIHSMKRIRKLSECVKDGLMFLYNNELQMEFTIERFKFLLTND